MINTFQRISAWILPDDLAGSDEQGRKTLFALFLSLLMIPLFIFGAVHLISGIYFLWIMDHLAALVMAGFIISLRFIKKPLILYRITIIMTSLMLFYWLITGAVQGYASIWIIGTPLFIFFLTGRREGLVWSLVVITGAILVFMNPLALPWVWYYQPDYVSRHLFTLFITFLFTYFYESMSDRYKKAIKNEQGLLVREKERLAEAKAEVDSVNERLRREMDVRLIAEEELRKHRDHLEEIVMERTRELRRSNLDLGESENRYRILADNVTDLIFSLDMDFRILYISPSIQSMYGYTPGEALTLSIRDIHTPGSFRKLMKVYHAQLELENGEGVDPSRHVVLQLRQRRKDGSLFDVEVRASFLRDDSGKPSGIVGIARDITERVRAQRENEEMQEQLAQAQKMEAVGTLAGGLAHDFNNILSGILGSFDLLRLSLKKEELEDRETVDKYLEVGMESARRSVNLIKELLTLSQRHEIKLEPIDMNAAVRHIQELCTNSLPKSIALEFAYSPERPMIMGDTVQIGQVLLNLCINASHAMTIMRGPGERQGGTLSVTVEIAGFNHHDAMPGDGLSSSGREWVRIVIADTGVGMDRDTVTRIYEPFYTRKKRGEGTGLGLAISYNIIQKHGGHIRVDSEPGAGSRFTLYFPACDTCAEPDHGAPAVEEPVSGTGVVLIIDDEPTVLKVARGALEQSGYEVITANSPDMGVEVFRSSHNRISAVIIDLSMPGKSGLEVFAVLKEIDPAVRAILSSGMLDNESKERALALGIKEFANKPYMARELAEKVRGVLM
ncbi:MAG: PAS domain S-box protein [Spirochaetes bacterium]|nr:PAS domain S-box protein [Spirochaetota bacterium]